MKLKLQSVLVYICILISLLGLLYLLSDAVLIRTNTRYTVGETLGRSYGRYATMHFKYRVNGVEYTGATGNNPTAQAAGGRYLVKFNVWLPSVSTMYFDYQLKDSTTAVPDSGWMTRPSDIWVK
ncbi:hypothetical protein HGH92_32885 [Chitinophaga varians]|uniref:Uncharacterized protein n=1 Tax=Chitinophaga varians TaxID=2202339 RepID=A0A847RU87_9BACT|nr:hypothetical protein [Chitinophaga varians]NLR69140.1 hypothetical protein [Chitinophaga varians]